MMRRLTAAVLIAVSMAVPSTGVDAATEPQFVFQAAELPAFEDPTVYQLRGRRNAAGDCQYTYPQPRMPGTAERWAVRDLGIDDRRCIKLVEEGSPPGDASLAPADEGVATDVATLATSPTIQEFAATATVSSGYHKVWFENIAGQLLTGDTTYLTWSWNGSCATSGSTYGGWDYNYAYGWGLIGKGGTNALTCSRYTGETWSTFGNGSCRHWYSYVRAFGAWNGGFTGSKSASSNCGPVWLHADIKKTTG